MGAESSKPPFKDALVSHAEHGRSSDEKGKILQIGDDAGLIVRKIDLSHDDYFNDAIPDNLEELAGLLKTALAELEEKYGINVTPTRLVIAEGDDGTPTLFAVSDNITRSQDMDGRTEAKFALFNQLTNFIEDKARSSDIFLSDIIDRSQYVYGRKEGDTQDYLYLVDVDPKFNVSTPRSLGSAVARLDGEIYDHIRNEEDRLQKSLEEMRESYAPLIERLRVLREQLKSKQD